MAASKEYTPENLQSIWQQHLQKPLIEELKMLHTVLKNSGYKKGLYLLGKIQEKINTGKELNEKEQEYKTFIGQQLSVLSRNICQSFYDIKETQELVISPTLQEIMIQHQRVLLRDSLSKQIDMGMYQVRMKKTIKEKANRVSIDFDDDNSIKTFVNAKKGLDLPGIALKMGFSHTPNFINEMGLTLTEGQGPAVQQRMRERFENVAGERLSNPQKRELFDILLKIAPVMLPSPEFFFQLYDKAGTGRTNDPVQEVLRDESLISGIIEESRYRCGIIKEFLESSFGKMAYTPSSLSTDTTSEKKRERIERAYQDFLATLPSTKETIASFIEDALTYLGTLRMPPGLHSAPIAIPSDYVSDIPHSRSISPDSSMVAHSPAPSLSPLPLALPDNRSSAFLSLPSISPSNNKIRHSQSTLGTPQGTQRPQRFFDRFLPHTSHSEMLNPGAMLNLTTPRRPWTERVAEIPKSAPERLNGKDKGKENSVSK